MLRQGWLRVSLLVLSLAAACGAMFAEAPRAGCATTRPPYPPFVPPTPFRPDPAQGTFWYGTNALWTQLPMEGVWRGLPQREQGYFNKLPLWRQGYDWRKEPKPDIFVVLRRRDADAPLVIQRGGTNMLFDPPVMLTGVTFPTDGCWEVTAYHEGDTLTFVVSVEH